MSWIEKHKFTSTIVVMAVIWSSLLIYFIIYGQAIMQDPCSSCAKQMGEDVRCTAGNYLLSHKTFFVNGSTFEEYPERRNFGGLNGEPLNFSEIET